jgi:hypothetical protein
MTAMARPERKSWSGVMGMVSLENLPNRLARIGEGQTDV